MPCDVLQRGSPPPVLAAAAKLGMLLLLLRLVWPQHHERLSAQRMMLIVQRSPRGILDRWPNQLHVTGRHRVGTTWKQTLSFMHLQIWQRRLQS